jgi:tetratricopeptide (TPR) repeat protein
MNSEKMYRRAAKNAQKGNFNDAIRDYTDVIQLDPSFKEAWLSRGFVCFMLDRYEDCIKDCSEAIRLDPQLSDAWCLRADSKCMLEEYEDAIMDFDEAIRLDPSNSMAYSGRGNAKRYLKDYRNAIIDYDIFIKLRGNDESTASIYIFRGDAKHELEEYVEAIEDFDKGICLYPKNTPNEVLAAAYNGRGCAKFELEKYDDANLDFQEAVTLAPEYNAAHMSLELVRARKENIGYIPPKPTPSEELSNFVKCVKMADTLYEGMVIGCMCLEGVSWIYVDMGLVTRDEIDELKRQLESYYLSHKDYSKSLYEKAQETATYYNHPCPTGHKPPPVEWGGCLCGGHYMPPNIKLKQCPYCAKAIYLLD